MVMLGHLFSVGVRGIARRAVGCGCVQCGHFLKLAKMRELIQKNIFDFFARQI